MGVDFLGANFFEASFFGASFLAITFLAMTFLTTIFFAGDFFGDDFLAALAGRFFTAFLADFLAGFLVAFLALAGFLLRGLILLICRTFIKFLRVTKQLYDGRVWRWNSLCARALR